MSNTAITKLPLFCGIEVSSEDFELIQEIVETYDSFSRYELACTVCELLDLSRPNGNLKEQEATAYLNKLEKLGLIRLPELRINISQKGKHTGSKRTNRGEAEPEIQCELKDLQPVELEPAESKSDREYWRELIDRYHYLGYKRPFGGRIFYFVRSKKNDKVLGCLQVSSPAWALHERDKWLGWSEEIRKKNLQFIVQNSRFLILPWIKVKGLASHILSLLSKQIVTDWEKRFSLRPVLIESFVDTTLYEGTCYRAANWIHLGETQGRGRMDRYSKKEKTIKSIWVYPLQKNFRKQLTAGK